MVTWRGMSERKTANSLRISGLLWCHQESNRGHKDFQHYVFYPKYLNTQRVNTNYFLLVHFRCICSFILQS